jgi:hypothetical protein
MTLTDFVKQVLEAGMTSDDHIWFIDFHADSNHAVQITKHDVHGYAITNAAGSSVMDLLEKPAANTDEVKSEQVEVPLSAEDPEALWKDVVVTGTPASADTAAETPAASPEEGAVPEVEAAKPAEATPPFTQAASAHRRNL